MTTKNTNTEPVTTTTSERANLQASEVPETNLDAVCAMDLLIQAATATTIEVGNGKDAREVPAYEITLKAVLPEQMVPLVLALAKAHVLKVNVLGKPEVSA